MCVRISVAHTTSRVFANKFSDWCTYSLFLLVHRRTTKGILQRQFAFCARKNIFHYCISCFLFSFTLRLSSLAVCTCVPVSRSRTFIFLFLYHQVMAVSSSAAEITPKSGPEKRKICTLCSVTQIIPLERAD